MFEVKMYLFTSYAGGKQADGWIRTIVEYQTAGGAATKEHRSKQEQVTGHRLELIAFSKALADLEKPCVINLYTESSYIISALDNCWITKWKQQGWKNAKGEPVKNADLWEQVDKLMAAHLINIRTGEKNEYKSAIEIEFKQLIGKGE